VANKMVNGSQQTIRFHVDDVCSSHKDKKVNDEFLKWLNDNMVKLGEVEATRGSKHHYLGMDIEFKQNEVIISMKDYLRDMIREFPLKLKSTKGCQVQHQVICSVKTRVKS
jgi:hypothetical protein